MSFTTRLLASLLAVAALAGCSKEESIATAPTNNSTIKVSVSEAGAPPYDLNQAQVLSSSYQTGAASLSISGKLNNGKPLAVSFYKNGNIGPNTTNAVDVTLDGTVGTNASGTTTYNPQTRAATGSFRATFPVVGEITGSFSGIPVQ